MTPPLITPVIKDEEGRMISRTMRATDELQVLMDFYYHTVPVVPHGEGVFCYKGQVLDGGLAPGDYGMASGDRVDFFLEMRPDTFVTVTVRDARGPEVTRTMRMTDAMQDLFEFYFEMTAHVDGTFVSSNGWRISPDDTPIDLEMEGATCHDVYFEPSSKHNDPDAGPSRHK